MLDAGFVDEVRRLRARGDLHAGLPSMRAVGYRQAWAALDGGDLGALAATRDRRDAPARQAPADLAALDAVAPGRRLRRRRRDRPGRRPRPSPRRGRPAWLSRSSTIAGLAKRYGASTVFEGVDLVLGAGEFVAVVGESGVGKSTLLNCAAGLDTIDAGRVRVAGTDIHALGESAQAVFRRHHLGFVFQAFHVLPHLTVAANVGLPLLLQHAPDPTRVGAMLSAVGLAGFEARLPHTLSGGQLQRVAIARALVHRPEAHPRRRADRQPRPGDRRARALAARRAGARARRGLPAGDALARRRRARRSQRHADADRDRRVMRALLRQLSWPELRHHPWRNAAALVAVMLGVALAFSVHLINASALAEFGAAVRAVNGEADLALVGPRGGFDEALYGAVAAAPGVAVASPVVEADTFAFDAAGARVPIRLVGLDALVVAHVAPALLPRPRAGEQRLAVLDPDAVFLNAAAERRLGGAATDARAADRRRPAHAAHRRHASPPAARRSPSSTSPARRSRSATPAS